MRILYVCADFGVPVYGHKGASIHLRAMARAFAQSGHDIHILSPAIEREGNLEFDLPVSAPVSMAAHQPALDLLRKADKAMGTTSTGHPARTGHEVRNVLFNQLLAGAADAWRAFGADFVYERYALFGWGGLAFARALGVPHVLEVNAPLCLEQERARGLHMGDVARAVEARVWSGTDAVLAVSEELAAFIRDAGTPAERVHVLANGVDVEKFAAAAGRGRAVRAELGLGAGPVIGFVGSLKSWHGTDVLLEAFATLRPRWPEARLLIVGDGPMAESLRALAQERNLGAAAVFTGAVDHARIPELLDAMDFTVAPYRAASDFYFSPMKIYESLAAGRPVVASNLGQVAQLIEAGYVEPAAPGDTASLAAAMERVLQEPARAAGRAARGRAWTLAERTWQANARRAAELALQRTASRH